MRVLAKASDKVYICEVTHDELEKFMNLYYGKLSTIKVGDGIDLSKGYDFYKDTTAALEKTKAFIDSNKKVIEAIFSGINTMAGMTEVADGQNSAS